MGWKDMAKRASGLVSELAEKAEAYLPQEAAEGRAREDERAEGERAGAERAGAERHPRPATPAYDGVTAELSLTLTGGEHGSLAVTLPVDHDTEEGRFLVLLEAPEPVSIGSTTLAILSFGVPAGYAGPGRYDLADLHRRAEAGDLDPWEAVDLLLSPHSEVDDRTWFVDVHASPPPVIEVGEDRIDFDLPMVSAVNAVRASGTVRLPR